MCSKALLPLKWEAVNRPLHDESEIISNVVAEPGDENVASNEPPLRLCNDGDFGITRVIVVAPTAVGICVAREQTAVLAALLGVVVLVTTTGKDLAIVDVLEEVEEEEEAAVTGDVVVIILDLLLGNVFTCDLVGKSKFEDFVDETDDDDDDDDDEEGEADKEDDDEDEEEDDDDEDDDDE